MVSKTTHVSALDLYRFAGRLGWKNCVKRLDLYRYLEYPAVIQGLQAEPGMSVLDVGSANTIVPLYLAVAGCRVLAVDIDERTLVFQKQRLATAGGKMFPAGHLCFERQDVRRLPYVDGDFDRITAISVIEHIPDDGDALAVAGMARVLKPGGRLGISFPYGSAYQEGSPPYDTAANHRIYNEIAIEQRIVKASGLREVVRFYFVDRWFDFEHTLWRAFPRPSITSPVGLLWAYCVPACFSRRRQDPAFIARMGQG